MFPVAARTLFRQPAFALAAVATLALGIAAPTALFSTVNAVLLKPLPYPRAHDIYTVRTFFPSGRFTIGLVASEEMTALQRLDDAVAATAVVQRRDVALATGGSARQVVAYGVSPGFFDLFGVPVAIGRSIGASDAVRGAPPVAVLSHGLWTSVYGGRADAVGTLIELDGRPAQIVGVAARAFDMPLDTDMWINMWVPETIGHGYDGYVRLKPGVAVASLQGRMAQAMEALGRKYPDQNKGRAYALRPLLDATVGDLGPILVILFGATALLLVLAAVNVSNLMLARGTGRAREIAVRAALGASRRTILRTLLSESVLLAVCGGVLGVAAAFALVRTLTALGGSHLPRLDAVAFDGRVAAFAASLVLLTGVLVGLAPALRLAAADPAPLLNESGRSVRGSRRTRRLLSGFVVAEIAVAVALVAGAARLVQSYRHLTQIDPGFDPRGRLALNVLLPLSYGNQARSNAWWQAVEARLRDAGAETIASSSSLPLEHEWDSTSFVDLVSRPDIPPDQRPNARLRIVSEGFFSALGVRMIAGRPFSSVDTQSSAPVAIVNEAFVRRSLPDVDPLRERVKGIRFRLVDGTFVNEEVAIVGVAADVKYSTLPASVEPVVYVPATQSLSPRRSIIVTTADGRPETRLPQFRAAIAAVDPKIPVDAQMMPEVVAASVERQRLGMWLMSVFGAAALLLAMVGIFGVIAYVVSQREGEMAIRQTFGATRGQVFWMICRDSGRLAMAGLPIGAVLAWWTGRLVARYVFDVRPADPQILAASAAAVALVAILATLAPAVRAATPHLVRALHPK